jgi:hypothetical protein
MVLWLTLPDPPPPLVMSGTGVPEPVSPSDDPEN